MIGTVDTHEWLHSAHEARHSLQFKKHGRSRDVLEKRSRSGLLTVQTSAQRKLLPADKEGDCATLKGSFCPEETKIVTIFMSQGSQNILIEADRISKRNGQIHRHKWCQCSFN